VAREGDEREPVDEAPALGGARKAGAGDTPERDDTCAEAAILVKASAGEGSASEGDTRAPTGDTNADADAQKVRAGDTIASEGEAMARAGDTIASAGEATARAGGTIAYANNTTAYATEAPAGAFSTIAGAFVSPAHGNASSSSASVASTRGLRRLAGADIRFVSPDGTFLYAGVPLSYADGAFAGEVGVGLHKVPVAARMGRASTSR